MYFIKMAGKALTKGWGVGLLLVGTFVAILVSSLPPAYAQGWWWGSPIDPSFDMNAVIKVDGTATQVAIISVGAPSTLQLQTTGETLSVILGPGWYLSQVGADIRNGDILSIEGSKMKDRRGHEYLLAARVTNHRTNTTFELRDKSGRPKWRGGKQSGGKRG
jgi:hypothetical protein